MSWDFEYWVDRLCADNPILSSTSGWRNANVVTSSLRVLFFNSSYVSFTVPLCEIILSQNAGDDLLPGLSFSQMEDAKAAKCPVPS